MFSYKDQKGMNRHVYEHNLRFEPYGRLKLARVYSYTYNGPMVNVLVLYK